MSTRSCCGALLLACVLMGCSGSESEQAANPAATGTPATAAAPAAAPVQLAPPPAPPSPPPPPPPPSPETLLRREVETWKGVPFLDNGATRSGIGNAGFVQKVFEGAFTTTIPASYDEQYRTGKLVTRETLEPGDLVFFEGRGFAMFRSKTVGIYLGSDEIALARKEDGVLVTTLARDPWSSSFKTARRIPAGKVATPVFDLARYGTNREMLLRDIAVAWTGTLYKAGGTTFEGIGNDEFVREVYGAIYETELDGDPGVWATMGDPVDRDELQSGDIVLYESSGFGGIVRQRHAGLYIGDGEFVSAVRGSAVTISKLDDPRWQKAYRAARRIDPDVLARIADERAAAAAAARSAASASAPSSVRNRAETLPLREMSDLERRLREVTEEWRGTPYKLGGTTKSGIDCSAFSRVLYTAAYDYELPRTAQEQERLGAKVERHDLQPGDLIFFRTQGMGPLFRSRHVGVYLGGGDFAQASGRLGVTISTLDNRYWSGRYHAARRLPAG